MPSSDQSADARSVERTTDPTPTSDNKNAEARPCGMSLRAAAIARHNACTLLAASPLARVCHRLTVDPDFRVCRLAILAICTSSVHGLIASHPSRFATSPVFAVRASVPVAQAAPGLLALPPAGYEGAVAAGEKKANMAPDKIFALAMISGAHIGFGAWLMLAVGGACPGLAATNPGLQNIVKGAFGLPFGLMMTLVTGAELFTGNTALVTAALLEKKASLKQLIKSWTVSYSGNLVGSILLASMVATGGQP